MDNQIDLQRQFYIDEDLESYANFLDYGWVKRVNLLADAAGLSSEVFDMTTEWVGVTSTLRMPWLMMNSVSGVSEGFLRYKPANVPQLLEGVLKVILEDDTLRPMAKQRLSDKCRDKLRQGELLVQEMANPFSPKKVWEMYLDKDDEISKQF